jgi:hypothetical protein
MQLRAVRLCLLSISGKADEAIFQECLSDINKLFKRAEVVVLDIDVFVSEIVQDSQSLTEPTENPKPSKRLWIRKKAVLLRLTAQVTSILTPLVATLQLLQSHRMTGYYNPQQNIVIQSIEVVQEPPQNANQHDSGLPLEHQLERAARQLEGVAAAANTTTSPRPAQVDSLSRRSSVDSFHSLASSHSVLSSKFVSICGTLAAEPCKPYCLCQCHLSTHVRMPAWAKSILGSISFHGNGSVLFTRRPCDRPLCRRGGSATAQFTYFAPAWTFMRNFNFHLRAESVNSLKSDFSFCMPRVIPSNAHVWGVIEFGKVAELRRMLAYKETSPHDTTETGSSVLHVSTEYHQSLSEPDRAANSGRPPKGKLRYTHT